MNLRYSAMRCLNSICLCNHYSNPDTFILPHISLCLSVVSCSPNSGPGEALICFCSYRIVLPSFPNSTQMHSVLSVWLLSFCLMFFIFIHFGVCLSGAHSFMSLSIILPYSTYHTHLFMHSPVGDYWSCIQLLTTINKADVNYNKLTIISSQHLCTSLLVNMSFNIHWISPSLV